MGIFEKALILQDTIQEYIPQRPPIVMVDTFFGIRENISWSGLMIHPDNIFVENDRFNEAGMIEHMAQSCALRVGYSCKQENKTIPVGYIGAIKNLKIYGFPKIGQQIHTQVKIEQEIFGITLVSTQSHVNETLIASCEMKIFLDKSSHEKE